MTSREIAELTAKRHDHVLRDIETMLRELGETSPQFWGELPDSYNRPQRVALLSKELSITLVAGYNVQMRHAIVKRWQELEAGAGRAQIAATSPARALAEAVASGIMTKRGASRRMDDWLLAQFPVMAGARAKRSSLVLPVTQTQQALPLEIPAKAARRDAEAIPRINIKRTAPDGISLVLGEVADYAGVPESELLRCMVARKLCDGAGEPSAQGRGYSMKSRGRVHWHVGKLLARLRSDK